RGSLTVASTRASQGSWSSPTRTRSAADLSRASWRGLTSTACGSWSGGARLSTATRSPPTASTSARRSVDVLTMSGRTPTRAAAPRRSRREQDGGERAQHLRFLGEDRFRDHAVNALAHVHDLRHAAIGGHRAERVGLVPTHRHQLLLLQEIHALPDRVHHRL